MELWRAELYHAGIKDQKWGRRRYQNPDGTYTDEGLERKRAAYQAKYGSKGIGGEAHARGRSENFETYTDEELKAFVDRKNMEKQANSFIPEYKTTLNKIEDTGSILKGSSAIANNIAESMYNRRMRRKGQEDLSGKTNDELQKTINRIRLEQQYRDLTKEGYNRREAAVVNTGQVLAGIGAAALATASVLSVIQTLRGKK